MITTEIKDGFQYTCSDKYKIKKVGTEEIYDEAYDLYPTEYQYEETNILKDTSETQDNMYISE